MTHHLRSSKTRRNSPRIFRPGGFRPALGLAGILLLAGCGSEPGATEGDTGNVAVVVRGPMRISVREGGDLESASPAEVRSAVEGRNAIIELIPEGTEVKKGDRLVVLDSAQLVDRINRQQIAVDQARSRLAQAKESYAIQEKQGQESLQDAETRLALARRALDGYTNGSLPLNIKELESDLMLAEESLKRAENEAEASERLYQQEIISKAEWEADVLKLTQAKERVEVVKGRLRHLADWTSKDEIQRLESDVTVRELARDRVRQQVASELAQREDSVVTAERNFKLETEQLEKLVSQLDNCTLYAPRDGLVVYAKRNRGGRMGGDDPIALGTEIRERESIITIPDLQNLLVRVDIHESSIKKVTRGQRAWVKVDAQPDRTYLGTVTSVGLVPSTQSSWMNPDLKVYETYVRIDEAVQDLKPGMYARVEILVAELADVLQVPLHAVHQSGHRTFAYAKGAGGVELREIQVGDNNDSTVHIRSGLNEGDVVYLSRPEGAPALPAPEKDEFVAPASAASGGGAPGSGAGGSARRPVDDGNIPAPSGSSPGGGEGRRGNRPPMTPEQRAAMAERMQGMSEEERQRMREGMRRGDAPRERSPAGDGEQK